MTWLRCVVFSSPDVGIVPRRGDFRRPLPLRSIPMKNILGYLRDFARDQRGMETVE